MSGLVGYATSDSEAEADPIPEPRAENSRLSANAARETHTAPPSRTQTEHSIRSKPQESKQPTPTAAANVSDVTPSQASDAASTQTALHNLTLPPVPNLDIPPSPPGSPRAATAAKVTQFLALKGQGVHFNAKLAESASLRNPALLEKLISVAGLEKEELYGSSLSREVWDPFALKMGVLERGGLEFVRGKE